MGSIHWPLELQEDAFEAHRYQNREISGALEDCFSAVLAIVSKEKPHPLMEDFDAWMQGKVGGNKARHAFDFGLQFSFPILPGDLSLANNVMAVLDRVLRTSGKPYDSLLLTPATVLFNIVILRTYLHRPASNDMQIYHLARNLSEQDLLVINDTTDQNASAKRGWFRRNLSLPEQVLAAGQGNTGADVPPPPMFCKIRTKLNKKLRLEEGFQSASPLTDRGKPYIWYDSNNEGLTGGEAFTFFEHGSSPTRTPQQPPADQVDLTPESHIKTGVKRPWKPNTTAPTPNENQKTSEPVLRRSKRLKK